MRTTLDLDLDLARNAIGKLREDVRARLRRYDFDPCESNWDDVHGLMLQPNLTLWQAWIATDPAACQIGPTTDAQGRVVERWQAWPDRRAFHRAIFYATH